MTMAFPPYSVISTPASSMMPSRIIPRGSSPWTPAARGLCTGRWRDLPCWEKRRLDFVNGVCMLFTSLLSYFYFYFVYFLVFCIIFFYFPFSPPRSFPPICFFLSVIYPQNGEPLEIYPDWKRSSDLYNVKHERAILNFSSLF